ncbi:hypothetical protein SAMN05421770_101577 [Granulicella rosea]|uniref:Uncharacterized protein n=1 Tax=Granulicella rosea TaxID=474952 RepID=A0A239DQK0_9BACT|nr:hypothetical protein SAMN05421770_101577 [Granulicella rosea]
MWDILVALSFLAMVAAPSMVAMKNAIKGFAEDAPRG